MVHHRAIVVLAVARVLLGIEYPFVAPQWGRLLTTALKCGSISGDRVAQMLSRTVSLEHSCSRDDGCRTDWHLAELRGLSHYPDKGAETYSAPVGEVVGWKFLEAEFPENGWRNWQVAPLGNSVSLMVLSTTTHPVGNETTRCRGASSTRSLLPVAGIPHRRGACCPLVTRHPIGGDEATSCQLALGRGKKT